MTAAARRTRVDLGERVTEKRQRRTQAERSATTRASLLNAAVKCLYEHGYGATTTIMIAQEAGVSRGAMLHQFPSKADLMTFVVEAVHDEAVALYAELLAGIVEPRERLLAYPGAVWKVDSRPAGVAVMEIFQGSRSDAELAAKLAPVEAKIEADTLTALSQEFRRPSAALLHLIVGAVRGLSITQVIKPEQDATEAIALLQRLLEAGIDAHVMEDGVADPAKSRGKPKGKSPVT